MTRALPALCVHGLAAPFGDGPGLTGIVVSAAAGERLAIVGPSGAGKTTLLRAIAGLGPVTAGRIEIDGRDAARVPPERRGAVYLHQTPVLFPHLSVGENVAFPLRVRGVPGSEVRARAEEALAAVRLDGFCPRRIASLSGGQRHRVALARAVVARPAVLLLDEPLTGLDPALRDEVREALGAIHASYLPAIVLVTHDLDEAGIFADRIGVLLDGTLAQTATPGELFARPASLTVARFLGFPNEIPIVVRDGRFEGPLGAGRLPVPLRAGPAVAIFRPEAISTAPDGAPARIASLRHRAGRTTAVARLGGLELELPAEGDSPPVPGDEVRVVLDPNRVRFFPA